MNKFAVGFVGAKGQHTVFHGDAENVDFNMKPYFLEQREARAKGSFLYTLSKHYFNSREDMEKDILCLKTSYSGIADKSEDISHILNLVTV